MLSHERRHRAHARHHGRKLRRRSSQIPRDQSCERREMVGHGTPLPEHKHKLSEYRKLC
ncbi:DUF922 domain-containing protein [Bradyrhizobium sp. SRL28]|uniref:DUF922 domain-containing protein n=1 Tax=Bradyrhizobium sp. SRL28 TaxID=2836178 RepID=UPI0035B2714E